MININIIRMMIQIQILMNMKIIAPLQQHHKKIIQVVSLFLVPSHNKTRNIRH